MTEVTAVSNEESGRRLVPTVVQGVFVLGICLFLVMNGNTLTTSFPQSVSIIVVVTVLVLIVVDYRLSLYVFVLFLFAYEEFDLQSSEAFVNDTSTSILLVRIMGISIMDFATVLFLLPVLLRDWRSSMRTGAWRFLQSDVLLVPIIIIYSWGVILGPFHMRSLSDFTWELRHIGHVLTFYYIFSRTFVRKEHLKTFFLLGGSVFLLKNVAFVLRYLSGGGLEYGIEYTRIILGSDLTLTAISFCASVAALLMFPKVGRGARYTILLLAIYFAIMFLGGLGRFTYLFTAVNLVIIYYLNRKRVNLQMVIATIVLTTISVALYFELFLSPSNKQVISYAMTSAFNWWDALQLYGDLSLGTRLFEVMNVWETLGRSHAWLWGMGWGAPWQELAALQPYDAGSFGLGEQISGVHVQAHIDATIYILKVGIVGTLILYGSFFRFWKNGVQQFRRETSDMERYILLLLLMMVVIIAPNYVYFIRLKILLGFSLAGIGLYIEKAHSGHA